MRIRMIDVDSEYWNEIKENWNDLSLRQQTNYCTEINPSIWNNIEAFLETIQSEQYRRHNLSMVRNFFLWITLRLGKIDTIVNIDPNLFDIYFNEINLTNDGSAVNKLRYKLALQRFMGYCIQPLPNKKELKMKFDNLFCKDDTYTKFNGNGKHLNFELYRTKEEVYELLNKIREVSFEDYIFFSILIYTGMRRGGASNILIENVDLEARRIITDEKLTEWNGKDNQYVIPIPFVSQLEAYIIQIKEICPEQKKLFDYSSGHYYQHFKGYDLKRHPHQLRDVINTFRMKKGCNDSVLAILLNQKPKGVNAQNYMKIFRDFSVRRDYFDYYFPFYDYFHYYFKPMEWKSLEMRVKDLD